VQCVGVSGDSRTSREALIEDLQRRGCITSDAVAKAMRAVPRDAFVPTGSRDVAYVDAAVILKCDRNGSPISSISQPTMVAMMLELLRVRRGDRVLEVGTGSGYNAALLSQLVGDDGEVVTIEIENDLAVKARRTLARLAIDRVKVILGDGYQGHNQSAPYNRIIVTTGVPAVAREWGRQLASDGRLVVPVTGKDGVGEVLAFVRRVGGLECVAALPCGFLPIRRKATNA